MSKNKHSGKPVTPVRTGYLAPATPAEKAATPPTPPTDPFTAMEDPVVTEMKLGVELADIDVMLAEPIPKIVKPSMIDGVDHAIYNDPDMEEEAPLITSGVAEAKHTDLPEATRVADRKEWQSERMVGSVREAAVLSRGGTLSQSPIKEGADPLTVECLNLFEKLQCGGAIVSWNYAANDDVSMMITKLRQKVCV